MTEEQKAQIRRAANELALLLIKSGADLDLDVVKTPLHEVGKQEPTMLYSIEITRNNKEKF